MSNDVTKINKRPLTYNMYLQSCTVLFMVSLSTTENTVYYRYQNVLSLIAQSRRYDCIEFSYSLYKLYLCT